MATKSIDLAQVLDMIEPPADLVRQTTVQQANAPYSGLGFTKDRLAPEIHERLLKQFQASAPAFRSEGSTLEIRNDTQGVIPSLYYEDIEFNRQVHDLLQPAHEQWSKMRLQKSACYGFRVYQRGTYLHNHVDITQTHIISSTICIDCQLDSPWPLYIEDINGQGYQVNLEPGEFVYYEGAKLIHGRPYPMNGDYYAGMFVHYRPEELPGSAVGLT